MSIRKSFSLIELLVVLVIIAIIAAIAVPAINGLFDEKDQLKAEAQKVADLLYEARNQAIAGKKRVWLEVNTADKMISIVSNKLYFEVNEGEEKDDPDEQKPSMSTEAEDYQFKSVFCRLANSVSGFYADATPVGLEDETDVALREESVARQQAQRDVTVNTDDTSFRFSFSRFGSAAAAGVRLTSEFGSFDVITDFLTGKPTVKFNNTISGRASEL